MFSIRQFHFPLGTAFLILVCVFVFIISLVLSLFGINLNHFLAIGRWQYLLHNPGAIYTIISSMFAHANFFHIFFNMLALLFLGSFLESIIGTRKFLAVFFITGVVGNLAFLLQSAMNNEMVFALGASGAIFGIAGVLVVLRPKIPVYVFPFPIALPLWVAILFNLLFLYLLSFSLPIANSAHIGGFVAGLVCGYFIKRKEEERHDIKIEWAV